MEYKISVIKIIHDTIVDGTGFRTSIYCAGCGHQCRSCHNPESWDINSGTWMTVQEIYNEALSNPLTNITFTGGEPMLQAEAFCELAKMIKSNSHKNIWCYTGFLFEDIVRANDSKSELLSLVDCIVDGKYEESLKCHLPFRGSANQRIILAKESLNQNRIIMMEDD